jgi:hypothetical protein
MAGAETQDDGAKVASHTLAYLRTLDKKVDLVLETMMRFGERLGRVERDVGEGRRDVLELKRDIREVKSDIVLLENKVLSSQSEILLVLHRLANSGFLPSQEGGNSGNGP